MPRGGKRQWLSCLNCGRRVFKLYRPSWESEGAFACRHCYRLTYQSARQHDARLYSLLKAPDAVLARQVLHGTPAWKFLAMKAAYIRSGKIRTKWPLQCEEGTISPAGRKSTKLEHYALTPAFLDRHLEAMATQMEPHPRHGFRDVIKAARLLFQRLGMI